MSYTKQLTVRAPLTEEARECAQRVSSRLHTGVAPTARYVNPHGMVPPQVLDAAGGHVKGCACRKSRCLKKYCECFLVGVRCTDYCRCACSALFVEMHEVHADGGWM